MLILWSPTRTSNSRPLSGPSISQLLPWDDKTAYSESFSSPLGAIYISMAEAQHPLDQGEEILVPSRGHLYLNSTKKTLSRKFAEFSSPLGAIYISILSPAPPVNTGLKLRFAAQTEMGCPVPPFCSPQPSFSRYLQGAAENQVLRSFIP